MRIIFHISALAGAWILYAITPEEYQGSLGALSLHPKLSTGIGLVIELILTFQLIWTVIASTDPIRKFTGFQAPIAIGMSVTIGLLMGVSLIFSVMKCDKDFWMFYSASSRVLYMNLLRN